jgi:hypothetical protein
MSRKPKPDYDQVIKLIVAVTSLIVAIHSLLK